MKKSLAGLAVAAMLTLTACGGSDGGGDAGGDLDTSAVLKYSTVAGVTSFDPHKNLSPSAYTILNFAYDRLVHTDADGKAVPGLAESWEFSDDLKTLTLQLREGLSFSDGTPFDAEAVKANLERAAEPDSIGAAHLSVIKEVEAVDASTVRLTMDRPAAELVLTLSDAVGMMVRPGAFADPEKLALQPDGIGRFTLASSEPGTRYEFAAVEGYWAPDDLKLGGLEVSVQVDPQTNLNGVQSGEFDCALVSPAMVAPAEELPDSEVVARTVLTSTVLYFNQSKGALSDERVRLAIAHAIDKEAVLQGAQEGQGEVADSLFPADYWVDGLSGDYGYDQDKARELLAEAGLTDEVAFTIVTNTIPQFSTTAEIVKDQLAQVGIDVTIKALPPLDVATAMAKGEGDAVVSGWTGRPDPANLFSSYFAADAPGNYSKVEPEGYASAMAAANAVEDQDERASALAETADVALGTAAVVPLTFNVVGSVCNDKVQGYEHPIIGMADFRGVGIVG